MRITTKDKKDGASMCQAFERMIDETDKHHNCETVCLCTDCNRGSGRGRKDLVMKRPWLFVLPYCAHQVSILSEQCHLVRLTHLPQFQLLLGDYFKENKVGADIVEKATDLIEWLWNHQKVRVIFDKAQASKNNGTVLAYIVANLTRWTTHFLAFDRLVELKLPLHEAAYLKCDPIIEAQVGPEKSHKERDRLTASANEHCDLIENLEFWKGLETIVKDIEPLCYGTNINQSDKTRADQVLLTFVGIYLHFS